MTKNVIDDGFDDRFMVESLLELNRTLRDSTDPKKFPEVVFSYNMNILRLRKELNKLKEKEE